MDYSRADNKAYSERTSLDSALCTFYKIMAWIDRKKIGSKLIIDLMNVAGDNAVPTTIIIILMAFFNASFNRRWEKLLYI